MSWSDLFRRSVRGRTPAQTPAPAPIKLVPDWIPPAVKHVPAKQHVESLLSMASSAGVQGYVRSKDVARYYAETCWMHGYVPLADWQILCELGAVLEKRRIRVDGRQLTYYWVPSESENVLPLRRRKARKRNLSHGNRVTARRALARSTANTLAA